MTKSLKTKEKQRTFKRISYKERVIIENKHCMDKKMISDESIYQHVYGQIYGEGNGTVKKGCEDLRKYLTRRHKRRQKKGFRKAQKLERMGKLPSIEDRPKEEDERKAVGHYFELRNTRKSSFFRLSVIPAPVFTRVNSGGNPESASNTLDPRLRGDDGKKSFVIQKNSYKSLF